MTIAHWGWIGILGAAGACLRSWIALRWDNNTWPWGTLGVNVLGSMLAAALMVIALERKLIPENLAWALMLGFLGGFTTFSSYSIQTLRLLDDSAMRAMLYGIGSPLLSLLGAFFAFYVTRAILR